MTVGLKNLFVGQLTNANVAVYTPAAAGISARISAASVYNKDSSDHLVDIFIVPSGGAGAAADGTTIYENKLVPANSSISLDLLRGANVIGAGSLVAKADANSVVTLSVFGVELS